MAGPDELLRPTDGEAVALGRALLRSARHGALATLDPEDGAPLASRVAVSTDIDGTPVVLVSALSAHTSALRADPRCSVLVGEAGKGDPLAHPRMSIACVARPVANGGEEHARLKRRHRNHHPGSGLYADLPDFAYFRLVPNHARLVRGFGLAYRLAPGDLLAPADVSHELATAEQGAIEHMNADHRDAIALYAAHFAKAGQAEWTICGIDPHGLDLVSEAAAARVAFAEALPGAGALRDVLVAMAAEARSAIVAPKRPTR